MSRIAAGVPYWSREAADLTAALGSGPAGLSPDAAAERLVTAGPNSVEEAQRLGALRLLVRQVASPLVLILLFGAAISLFLREWVDAAIILVVVLGSTLLGFYQEYRASTAVDALKQRLALTCRVIRGGTETTVPATTIVPGDIVVLSAGNLVPADGLVIQAADFLVNEAGLTGESFPRREAAGRSPRRHHARQAHQRRLPRRVGAKRHGESADRRHRPPDRLRRHRQAAGVAPLPRPSSDAASASSAICSSA
ncbi:MAG: cation-transporting P-type ATPase [Bauldia sp.]